MKESSVYLVGAGPGDAGLITVRGLELVRKADVVVYDQLGTAEFLSQVKEGCELINVGKFAGNHRVPQDGINEILKQKALEGKMVVRLKGGDPFIFGRGGEEMLYLTEAGINCQVVPGVTSAISAPSYAGIPITQRGYTCSMAIVTGHEASKEVSDINWQALAGIGTVIFLMGVKNLPKIVKNLTECGRAPETPVAMIQHGTLPIQRTVTGTLADIVNIAREADIQPPAVTVVGEVVALRQNLEWFEKRPFFGKTIVVTRSRMQASSLLHQLKELGARAVECPAIRIIQHQNSSEFSAFIEAADAFEHLVFTSVNGVDGFVEALTAVGRDLRFLGPKKIVCIGPATAQAFIDRGITPDFVPETYVAEALFPYFEDLAPCGVAILRAEKAREVLPETLKQLGHNVNVVPIYHTEYETPDAKETVELLEAGKVDLVTFTSSSTVEGFVKIVKNSKVDLAKVRAASIGPITSQTCRDHGIPITLEAKNHSIPGLITTINQYFKES